MKNKKYVALALLSFSVICLFAFVNTNKTYTPYQKQVLRKIVIDAGHGGTDAGAHGKYSYEKDISLAISLQLQKVLQEQMPDVEIYMTRTTDIFDNVRVKAIKANQAKGDLFICIHCNDAGSIKHSEVIGYKTVKYKKNGKSYTKKVPQYHTWRTPSTAKGTETYIWGIGKNDDKEDAVKETLSEDNYIDSASAKEIKSFDPTDPAQMIAISLRTQQYGERSRNLALTVEDEFVKAGRFSRGAKQRNEKGIWVLQATNMPAILVETGFISNPDEEDYLNSTNGQKETAECIVRAVKRYRYSLEHKIISNIDTTKIHK
jgi:N-acetylmuramoyl-L-alanine amidase